MKDDLRIRPARKDDLKYIAKILMVESAKKPYSEKYTLKTAMIDVRELSEEDLYVAVKSKKIVGFIASCITSKIDKRAYVSELWVLSDYQGQGIGSALLSFVEKMYAKKGLRKIRLTTRKDADAFRFYGQKGYNEYKKLVYMEKNL